MKKLEIHGLTVHPNDVPGHLSFYIDGYGRRLAPHETRELRDYLTEFLGDTPSSVDDDKVEELIQAGREWATTLPHSVRNLGQETIRLRDAIAAFDPPDPDADLRTDIKTLLATTATYDAVDSIINMVRNYDSKK